MARYDKNVFLNVPYDKRYSPLSDAIVFAIYQCGFTARSAREIDDSGQARVEKILNIIEQSKFGIHDISRAGIDRRTRLSRFNMPVELGLFLGAKRYGSKRDRAKRCLILDRDPHRYRIFCSDISGQDIRAHGDDPQTAVTAVRDWLSMHTSGVLMPGGAAVFVHYQQFRAQLPEQARDFKLDHRELTFGDYTKLVVGWLRSTPW